MVNGDKSSTSSLSMSSEAIPAYLKEYLNANRNLLSFLQESRRNVAKVRCGRKIGQRLSDADLTWGEHRLEVWMQDTEANGKNSSDSVVHDVIVKHYCKYWVDGGTRLLDGESCLQLLTDGSNSYSHDSLIYELKEAFSMDNVQTAVQHDGYFQMRKVEQSKIDLDIIDFHKGKKASPMISHEAAPAKVEMKDLRVHLARTFMTEFNGTQDCGKVFERGCEASWTEPASTVYRKSHWWTRFSDSESVKETLFVETDATRHSEKMSRGEESGEREGSN